MPGIAAGWLDYGTTVAQEAVFFTIVDHCRANSVFHTATRIEHLHFCQHQRLYATGHSIEAYQRGIAYYIEHGVIITHLTCGSGCFLIHRYSSAHYVTIEAATLPPLL